MSQFVQFEDNNFQETEESKKVEKTKSIDFKQYLNVFEFETVLPGTGESVKYKPIIVSQLKKLLTFENESNQSKIENLLDELISECVISDNFNINNLYLQDRFFIIIKLREKTKGSIYDFTLTCPKCKGQSIINVDLSKLKVNKRKNDIEKKIKLNDNISIELDYIKRSDYKESLDFISKKKYKSKSINEIDNLMAMHASSIKKIITPDGNLDNPNIENKIYFIENIPAYFYDKIREWHEENDFGIDFSTKVKCIHCDEYEEELNIPLSNFFL